MTVGGTGANPLTALHLLKEEFPARVSKIIKKMPWIS
jgi:hypothetical protein